MSTNISANSLHLFCKSWSAGHFSCKWVRLRFTNSQWRPKRSSHNKSNINAHTHRHHSLYKWFNICPDILYLLFSVIFDILHLLEYFCYLTFAVILMHTLTGSIHRTNDSIFAGVILIFDSCCLKGSYIYYTIITCKMWRRKNL